MLPVNAEPEETGATPLIVKLPTTSMAPRNLVMPLTSKANSPEISLFIATDEEPEPIFTFLFKDTSPKNKARFETYKFPFKDKS